MLPVLVPGQTRTCARTSCCTGAWSGLLKSFALNWVSCPGPTRSPSLPVLVRVSSRHHCIFHEAPRLSRSPVLRPEGARQQMTPCSPGAAPAAPGRRARFTPPVPETRRGWGSHAPPGWRRPDRSLCVSCPFARVPSLIITGWQRPHPPPLCTPLAPESGDQQGPIQRRPHETQRDASLKSLSQPLRTSLASRGRCVGTPQSLVTAAAMFSRAARASEGGKAWMASRALLPW